MPIVIFVFLGLVFLDIVVYAILGQIEQSERISTIYKSRRIARIVILTELNVLNLVFVLIPIKYVIELVIVVLLNVATIVYFFYDLVYLSERRKEYILWLQSVVFSQAELSDVFDYEEDDGSEYLEVKAFPQQLCSIVQRKKKLCIQVGDKNKKCFLIPKQKLTEETLTFYCCKIELDIEKRNGIRVYSKDVPAVSIKEYEKFQLSKLYLKTKEKGWRSIRKLLPILLFIIILMIVTNLIVCTSFLHVDPFAWMFIEI